MTAAAHTDQLQLSALEAGIGPRGSASINSYNRNAVRKWLCARGVPSPIARSLTIAQLTETYNDTTDRELSALTEGEPTMTTATARRPEPAALFDQIDPAPAPQIKAQQQQAAAPDVSQVAALLAQLLATGKQTPMDESRVIELIQEHAPIRSVEIKKPEREPVRIDGQAHKALPKILTMLSVGVNVWLAGPAGSGKTTLAEQTAEALELPFYSTGAVSSSFRLFGFMDATGNCVRTPLREAWEHGGVFLWDEIDASNPNALVEFNQALANGIFAFPDGMVKKHPDFRAIAAANTYGHGPTAEYTGRHRIDATSVDRFVMVHINYDEDLERALVGKEHEDWARTVQKARALCAQYGLRHIVSPRATINGAKLLAAGLDRDEILESTIRKGLDQASWDKIRREL